MMKKFLLPVFLLSVIFMNAQSIYEFQTENVTYQNLVNSISLNNGEIWDDPEYTVPLGFELILGGRSCNTIYFPEDGIGGSLATTPFSFGTRAIIIPIGQDLVDLGETTGTSLSPISYKIDGTMGNRILKIEWNNAGFWDDSSASDFINFQVWFFEGTNSIEFRYGPNQVNNPQESYEEEDGPVVAFAPLYDSDNGIFTEDGYFLTGNPTNPNVVILTGDDEPEGSLVGNIPDGTVYRFIPQPLSVDDFSKIGFQIYPIPTSEYLNIKTQSIDYNFNIYNSLGQKMNVSSVDNRIDVSNLSNGIYFIKIETETGSTTKKFLKQ